MRNLLVDNYIINTPIIDILYKLQLTLTNGKLRDIKPGVDNIVVTCPVHAGGRENSPALNIYIGDNEQIEYGYVRCFVCEFQSNFIKFVSACFESSIDFAKNWLIDNFDSELAFEKINLGEDISLVRSTQKVKYLDPAILDTYQSYCPYLAKRKLSREVCEQFNIKYDPKFRQVIFPCYDNKGNLLMMAKRAIDYKSFYLDKHIEKPVYCLDYIIKNNINTCVVVEGLIDCLTVYEYGAPAIATLGVVSDSQIEQINKSCLTTIYTCFDNDDAGKRFTDIFKKKVSKRILIIEVDLPNGKKDVNDLTKEEFQVCILAARNK